MLEEHDEHSNLFRDDEMLDYGPDTKYLSPPGRLDAASRNQRVLAEYDEGKWRVEAQVRDDGEWYIANREVLPNPPSRGQEYTALGRKVKTNYGMFSGLSLTKRVILAPLYAISFGLRCIRGDDVNLQVLEE